MHKYTVQGYQASIADDKVDVQSLDTSLAMKESPVVPPGIYAYQEPVEQTHQMNVNSSQLVTR